MSWFKTGTVAVTSGSPNLVFTGANLIDNKAAIAGMGIKISGSDKVWEISTVDSNSTGTMAANWNGSTASGLSFEIVPIQGFQVDLAYQLAQQALTISAWTTLAAAAAVGAYIQFLGSPVVPTARTPIQVATDLSNNRAEATVASATNCNIGGAASPDVEISGTTTITSLNPSSGTKYNNCIRNVRFSGAGLTLTNGSTLVLPGGANIVTAPGDQAVFKSDGSATPVWTCIRYTRAASAPCTTVSPTFTGTLTAAAASFSGNIGVGGAAYGEAGYNALSLYAAGSGSELNFMRSGAVSAQLYETSSGLSIAASSSIFIRPSGGGTTVTATSSLLSIGTAIENTSGGIKITATNPVMRWNQTGTGARVWRWQAAVNGVGDFGIYDETNGAIAFLVGTDRSILVGTVTDGGWTGTARLEAKHSTGYAVSGYVTGSGGIALLSRVDNTGGYLAHFNYTTTNIGSVTVTGGGTGVAYNTTSDERLKNWLIDQGDYRAAIQALWIGDFEWKDCGTKAFGVRAQQAWEVMPHHMGVAKPANDGDQWHASAEPFGHLALWGVKDLYVMVEGVQVIVENHEGRIAALEREVADLKAARAA